MRNKLSFFLMLSLLSLFVSTQAQATQDSAKDKKIINDVPMLRLGDGYMSYDVMSRGETALNLPDTTVSYGDKQSEIYLSQAISQDDLSKTLNINVSANGGWGPFSSSASASYLHHTQDTQYTENFVYEELYYANGLLDISKLPGGVNALSSVAASIYTTDFNTFINRFGDSYIKQLPFGAVLLVNVQLQFSTTTDKQEFNGALGGNFGSLFNASATIQNIVNQTHISGNLEISAYQLGGDPEDLASIFSKDPSGQYYFTQCQLSDLTSCANAVGGVINYAQNNFSQQIKDATAPGQPPQGNLAVVGQPITDSYTIDFGLKPVPPLSQAAMAARYQLSTLYLDIAHDKNIVEHLINSPVAKPYMDPTASNAADQVLIWDLQVFDTQNAMSCYLAGQEESCPSTLNNIQTNIKPYDKQFDNMYVFTCSEQTVTPNCHDYSTNICNIYTGTRFVSYPYDASSYFGSISGQFTLSADSKTLTYAGVWTPPSSPTPSQQLSGTFTLNADGFYQAPQSQLQGFSAFCPGDVYIRNLNNPM